MEKFFLPSTDFLPFKDRSVWHVAWVCVKKLMMLNKFIKIKELYSCYNDEEFDAIKFNVITKFNPIDEDFIFMCLRLF